MNWKRVAKVARLVAYAVVPGAAGYVAYRHVIRPWLDKRAAKDQKAPPVTSPDPALVTAPPDNSSAEPPAPLEPAKGNES
jgi:hypothetical protein